MGFATASDALIAAAFWTGYAALALSALLIASALFLRLRLAAQREHEQRFSARWLPIFAACTEAVPDRLPALAPQDGALFLALWVRALESVRGATRERLVELAARTGADRLAVSLLASGDERKELIALAALSHLRLKSAEPLAAALMELRLPLVSLAAAQMLLRLDARRHLPQVIERAAEREDWPVARIAAMLQECDRDAVAETLAHALAARLERASQAESEIVRLLQLAKVANPVRLRPAVCRLLERPAPAQVVAAALAALWHPEDAEHARRALGHPEWFVRVAAVRALDRIGGAEDRERLIPLLSDPNWWVRYRTAQTLARLPGVTRAALETMLSVSSDRFAADMLAQVLAERDAR